MSFQEKYLKYKTKYNNLKKYIGGTYEIPGETHNLGMNIRKYYNNMDESNNIDESEYNSITKKNNIEYFNELYKNNNLSDSFKDSLLDKFNLYYKKLFLKGVGIENYPYGAYQLKNYISLSNDFIFLLNKNIFYLNDDNLKLHYLNVDSKNFIEVIRFEKDKNDNFVFSDLKSEKISDPGYVLKGIYYYPCLGSGIFLHCNNIKYYFNKLHAISEMHDEIIKLRRVELPDELVSSGLPVDDPPPSPTLERAQSDFTPGTKWEFRNSNDNLFINIPKEEIITKFIKEYKFGRFDPSKSIILSNIGYVCDGAKRFDYLNDLGCLSYLLNIFCNNNIKNCDDKIKNKIYELYYKIFSGELKISDLYYVANGNENIFSKFIIYLKDVFTLGSSNTL